MKRIRSRHTDSESLDLFDAVSREVGYTFGDDASGDRFVDAVSRALSRAKGNPVLLHGRRVEAMFGFVASALGKCSLVRQEDVGEIYSTEDTSLAPDFRLVFHDKTQMFVEVKNCHDTDPSRPVRLTAAYLERLKRYSELHGIPLKIAIYWSKWRIWALIDPAVVSNHGSSKGISMVEALPYNEIAGLGDVMLGTVAPLRLKFITDPLKPRECVPIDDSKSTVAFTIGEVKLFSGDVEILDKAEKNLAFYLMLHGSWNQDGPHADIQDRQLISVEFRSDPEEDSSQGQDFQFIGSLSSMISNAFSFATVDESRILRLAPRAGPSAFRILLDPDYKGQQWPLWRFHQAPRSVRQGEPRSN